MKKKILTAIVFSLASICCMSQTSDKVYVDDFNIEQKGQQNITVNMDNPYNVFCAFQFDMYLPEGISVALKESGELDASLNMQRKKANHSLSVERIKNGYYRFVCFSMTNSAFSGQKGPIVDIKVKTDGSLSDGETVTGCIENVILTKTNGQDFKPGKTTFNINVMSETGIDQIKGIGEETEVYDLNGNRIYNVKTLKNGVYIINGRKTYITDKKPIRR